jgi:hypothetical protein
VGGLVMGDGSMGAFWVGYYILKIFFQKKYFFFLARMENNPSTHQPITFFLF